MAKSFKEFKEFLNEAILKEAKHISNNTSVRAPRAPKAPKGIVPGVKVDGDTRAIVTCDKDTAVFIKKAVHSSFDKIRVRVMDRKEGAKVYIDTADKAGLDKALAKVKPILAEL